MLTEAQLKEQIELRRQTEARLWEKIKIAQKQRKKFEAQLKDMEERRLAEEKENFPITYCSPKDSGKENQKKASRQKLFDEIMAGVKELRKEKEGV